MSQESAATLHVEVAYAEPHDQRIVPLKVPPGTTALEAAKLSGLDQHFHDLVLDEGSRLGIFGQVVSASQPLQEGDRVEIYRPLIADPKEVRKQRAARARARRADATGAGENDVDTGGAAREPDEGEV